MSIPSILRTVDRAARVYDGKVVLVGILAIVLLGLQTSVGHAVLRASGVSRPNSTFVELYFTRSQALPSSVPASGRVEVSFDVANVATSTRTFAWQVSQTEGGGQLRLASGQTSVGANQTLAIARTLRVHCSTGRTQLRVSIDRPPARLTLWLACPSPR